MDPIGLLQFAGAAVAIPVAIITGIAAWWQYKAARPRKGAENALNHSPQPQVSLPAAPESNVLEVVLREKLLRVGCIMASPWFTPGPTDAEPQGIYPALFADIAQRNGIKVSYKPVRNNVAIALLQERKVDIVTSLLHTTGRAQSADFASFIHNVALVAVVRRDQNRIRVLGDLKDPSVRGAVVEGEIGAEVARIYYDMSAQNDRAVEVDTRDVPSIFYQVHQGSVEVAITTGARWLEFQKRDPTAAESLRLAFFKPLLLIPAGCMIKRGEREFAQWLEREMDVSRAKPELRALEQELLDEFADAIERI